ncbi:MAG: outer membrane protein assembly factor BamA [Planctomycetota bacterium]|nr:outer membrane protein assembly factor BamA [Planctomycetota bacterium]
MPSFKASLCLYISSVLLLSPNLCLAQGTKPIIERIEFIGLRRVSKGELIQRIKSRVGEAFSSETMSEDLERLYSLERFGSSDLTVPPVKAKALRGKAGGVRIVFTVVERPAVSRVKVTGAKAFKLSDLQSALKSEVGQIFDDYRAEQDVLRLREILLKKGFLYSSVSYKKEFTKAGDIQLTFETSAGPQVTIEELNYTGVRFFDDPDIFEDLQGFASKPRSYFGFGEEGYFSRENLAKDLSIIARFYRSRGFLDAVVALDKLTFNEDRDEVVVDIRVKEGPRYTIRKVVIQGNTIYPRKVIRKALAMRPGKAFIGNRLVSDVRTIQKLYSRKSHIHSKVRFDLIYDKKQHLLDVIYSIAEGPQVSAERILIEGNKVTKDKVIRRNLSVQPGQLFDGNRFEASLGRLGRLGYFSKYDFEFRPGTEEGQEDLVIKVVEKPTRRFNFGGGLDSNFGVFGNLSFTSSNFDLTDYPKSWEEIFLFRGFQGGGQSFSAALQPGRDRSQYRFNFNEPYLFDLPVLFGLSGFIRDRNLAQHTEGRIGVIPSLGYRLTQDLTLRLRHRLERVRVFDLDRDAVPDLLRVSGNNYVSGSRLSLRLNKNLIDQDLVRYSGYGGTLSYEVLGGPFGGDVHLSRAGLQGNWQTTLLEYPKNHRWVFGLRAQATWQEAFGPDGETPFFERFFAGGVNSLRGFEFRSVSPRDGVRTKESIGGDFLALATADFSFPIFKGFLRGVGFIDMGTVEREIRDFRARRVRFTAGFGFRVRVPGLFEAPVSLNFAFPLRSRRMDDEEVFSFNLGFDF